MESMTGVASARIRMKQIQLELHMRSVNHRYLDIQIRAPAGLIFFTHLLETIIRKQYRRGHIDLELKVDRLDLFQALHFQKEIAASYLQMMGCKSIAELSPELRLQLLRLPGVVELEAALPAGIPESKLKSELQRAVGLLKKSRQQEGRKISIVLKSYLRKIDGHIKKIIKSGRAYHKQRTAELQLEVVRKIKSVEPGPWIAEWLDKSSIAEELERLKMHVAAIRELVVCNDDGIGKRLDFFAQEMLREANTIASKAKDFHVRVSVIEIKTIVEDIKEQGRNLC